MPRGGGLQPAISLRIRLASVVLWSRLKTADWELGGLSAGLTGLSRLRVLSVIDITDAETLPSTGRAVMRSVEIIIER